MNLATLSFGNIPAFKTVVSVCLSIQEVKTNLSIASVYDCAVILDVMFLHSD